MGFVADAEAAGAPEWVRDALHDPRLAAVVLLSFRGRSRLGLEEDGEEKPSTSAAPPPIGLLGWGRRIKRSRGVGIPRIASATLEEQGPAAAAVEKRKGKRRASPQSPLEGYSSASASGGEEGARAGRSPALSVPVPVDRRTMVEVVAAANPRLPKVSPIQASCHIRRPSSKKLTKLELQAVERTLLEEKANLLKEMEVWRKSLDALRADNSKLQVTAQAHALCFHKLFFSFKPLDTPCPVFYQFINYWALSVVRESLPHHQPGGLPTDLLSNWGRPGGRRLFRLVASSVRVGLDEYQVHTFKAPNAGWAQIRSGCADC